MFIGISHIGIAVKDLDQAVRAYAAATGAKVGAVHEMPDMKAVMLTVGSTKLELMQPVGTGGPVARFIDSRGEGVQHICFEVDDIDAEIESLSAKGVNMIDKVARQGLEGMVAFIHPRATNGVLVEMEERED